MTAGSMSAAPLLSELVRENAAIYLVRGRLLQVGELDYCGRLRGVQCLLRRVSAPDDFVRAI